MPYVRGDLRLRRLSWSLIDQAERFLPEMVANARLNGHSWDEIARAIGTSFEEAHLRFDPAERLSRRPLRGRHAGPRRQRVRHQLTIAGQAQPSRGSNAVSAAMRGIWSTTGVPEVRAELADLGGPQPDCEFVATAG